MHVGVAKTDLACLNLSSLNLDQGFLSFDPIWLYFLTWISSFWLFGALTRFGQIEFDLSGQVGNQDKSLGHFVITCLVRNTKLE